MTLAFEAVQRDDAREQVTLWHSTASRLPFGKAKREAVAFDDWALIAPDAARAAVARTLQAWADDERAANGALLVEATGDGAALDPALIAQFGEADAVALGLPPAARLSLNLQSVGVAHQPDFRVETRWTRPNGLPAQATPQGARISHEGRDWRLVDPLWSTLRNVRRLNVAEGDAERQAALAALRQAIGDEDRRRVKPDGFIDALRISYATGFSLDLRTASGGFDFDPVLFSPERMREAEDGLVVDEAADGLLPPVAQRAFAARFRRGDGTRTAYLLDDGQILFLDPTLQRALRVVREAQSAGPEARAAFARAPQRRIAEALGEEGAAAASLFVETQQFSERVSGVDLWRKPVLPWVKPKPNSWLPEAFGLWVGDPPEGERVEIAPERIDEALDAVESAVREQRATFEFDGHAVPATEQTRAALADLKELADAADRPEAAEEAPSGRRYFLQVRDNLEDVTYAPLAVAPRAREQALPAFPATVRSLPKPHQTAGFAWLVQCWRAGVPGVLLADDMGLGKTFQALSFLAWLRAGEAQPRPVLIVAPTGLLANWRAEIERHLAPDALGPVIPVYGDALARMRNGAGRDIETGASAISTEGWAHAGVVLTTYETMRDYHLSFARQPFAAILYDEAQKLKNPASQMTRAAKTLNGRLSIAMTGTPVENRLQDLWSVLDVVHPGVLGSSKAFEARYPSSDREALRQLNDLLTGGDGGRPPLLLRRMKDECLDSLPKKHVHKLPRPMPRVQADAYDRVIRRALATKGQPGRMLEVLHGLRGVSLHPTPPEAAGADYATDSARLATTFQALDRIHADGEKALIFCESLAMQALLAVEIARRYGLPHPVARINGGVAGDQRQNAVDAFQAGPRGFDAMILSPKAGGVGLTLTAANHVIHLSRWWNPAVEDQATDRAFRIGQTRDVHVYLPQSEHPDPAIAPTSFDLKLDALMERKRELSRGLLLPGDDESDASALFDAVVVEAPEPAPPPPTSVSVEAPPTVAPAEIRPTLSIRPGPPKSPVAPRMPDWPRRIVYGAGTQRDLAIFERPVAGAAIATLDIIDPYACADEAARRSVVDFVAMLAGSAQSIEQVRVTAWDADSIDMRDPESNGHQRFDLVQRWRDRFGERPPLHHVSVSRRVRRDLHDRVITAELADGQVLTWDVGRGVDGVMRQRHACTVVLTADPA